MCVWGEGGIRHPSDWEEGLATKSSTDGAWGYMICYGQIKIYMDFHKKKQLNYQSFQTKHLSWVGYTSMYMGVGCKTPCMFDEGRV